MRKTPPVARLRLPPERESPPERVLVAADAPAKAPVESMEKSSPPAELTNCRKSPVAVGVQIRGGAENEGVIGFVGIEENAAVREFGRAGAAPAVKPDGEAA